MSKEAYTLVYVLEHAKRRAIIVAYAVPNSCVGS